MSGNMESPPAIVPMGAPKGEPKLINLEPSFIETTNNLIYFYAEIERERVLQLVKAIRRLNDDLVQVQKSWGLAEPPGIHVYVSSYGGSVFAGLSVMDEIIKSPIPVTTIVDGCCASAATLFSVVGKRRLIKEHSYMLIHQISSVFWGKHAEFQDEMENQRRLMSMIRNVYLEYTRIPPKVLEGILKHDLWLDAKTCLKYGLVDAVL